MLQSVWPKLASIKSYEQKTQNARGQKKFKNNGKKLKMNKKVLWSVSLTMLYILKGVTFYAP
jgi:hypothetical protein